MHIFAVQLLVTYIVPFFRTDSWKESLDLYLVTLGLIKYLNQRCLFLGYAFSDDDLML